MQNNRGGLEDAKTEMKKTNQADDGQAEKETKQNQNLQYYISS
jgi:hypothetical protein